MGRGGKSGRCMQEGLECGVARTRLRSSSWASMGRAGHGRKSRACNEDHKG